MPSLGNRRPFSTTGLRGAPLNSPFNRSCFGNHLLIGRQRCSQAARRRGGRRLLGRPRQGLPCLSFCPACHRLCTKVCLHDAAGSTTRTDFLLEAGRNTRTNLQPSSKAKLKKATRRARTSTKVHPTTHTQTTLLNADQGPRLDAPWAASSVGERTLLECLLKTAGGSPRGQVSCPLPADPASEPTVPPSPGVPPAGLSALPWTPSCLLAAMPPRVPLAGRLALRGAPLPPRPGLAGLSALARSGGHAVTTPGPLPTMPPTGCTVRFPAPGPPLPPSAAGPPASS